MTSRAGDILDETLTCLRTGERYKASVEMLTRAGKI